MSTEPPSCIAIRRKFFGCGGTEKNLPPLILAGILDTGVTVHYRLGRLEL